MSKDSQPVRTDDSLEVARDLWNTDVSSALGRVLKWVLTLGFVGVLSAAALGVWRYTDVFYHDALLPPSELEDPPYSDGSVIAVTADQITLRVAPSARPPIGLDGVFGIEWPGGHGRVGPILESTETTVVRGFEPVVGLPSPGDPVTVAGMTYLGDPLTELGIPYEEVTVDTQLGAFPAWFVEGESDAWIIFIHGKGAERNEALRALPAFVANGNPALMITYRNDLVAQPDPSGLYQFGLTEWRDLQAAVKWALDQGAERVILVGYSMGGSITMEFMHQSPFRDRVAGVVFDSPVLDLGRTVEQGAEDQGIPSLLTSLAKTVAAMRFGLNWSELDYLSKLERITVPILVFHGTEDRRVPIELSEELATALPHLVTFVPVEGAGHVESWNVARDEYERALAEMMAEIDAAIPEA